MGLYIRKAINLGPLRINISKGGLGFSFGITGLRIGWDRKGGFYFHAGRGGVYYKTYLFSGKRESVEKND